MPSLTLDQPWLSHQRKRDKRRYRITGQSEDGRACDVTKCQWLTGLDRQLPEIQRPPLLNLRFDVVLFTHRDATSRDDAIRLCGGPLQRLTNLIGIIRRLPQSLPSCRAP